MKEIVFLTTFLFVSLVHAQGTVIVQPAPKDYGLFQLIGDVGKNQKETFSLSRCDRDQLFSDYPARYKGCENFETKFSLNSLIKLKPGSYIVNYDGATVFVEVTKNKTTEVKLGKIFLNLESQGVKARVYIDITDKKQLSNVIGMRTWTANNQNYVEFVCGSEKLSEYCNILKNGSPAKYVQTIFTHSGSTLRNLKLLMKRFFNSGRETWEESNFDLKIAGGAWIGAGEFVSVLPGVYAVEFLDPDPATGGTEDQHGIIVSAEQFNYIEVNPE